MSLGFVDCQEGRKMGDKPQSTLEAFQELNETVKELLLLCVGYLRIDKLVKWLNGLLS